MDYIDYSLIGIGKEEKKELSDWNEEILKVLKELEQEENKEVKGWFMECELVTHKLPKHPNMQTIFEIVGDKDHSAGSRLHLLLQVQLRLKDPESVVRAAKAKEDAEVLEESLISKLIFKLKTQEYEEVRSWIQGVNFDNGYEWRYSIKICCIYEIIDPDLYSNRQIRNLLRKVQERLNELQS
jgi:hypothetical protein